jgi:hypothetical protein
MVVLTGKADPAWEWSKEECVLVEPALEVALRVIEDFGESGGERVTVKFGARHADLFIPKPVVDSAGSLKWQSDGSERSSSGAISVGQELGLAIHRISGQDIWSAKGEPLFTANRENNVVSQRMDRCTSFPPELSGGTLELLRKSIGKCSEADNSLAIEERRRALDLRWGEHVIPSLAYAAECGDGPGERN